MSDDFTKLKWDEIYSKDLSSPFLPSLALSEYTFLLPTCGEALDLACGRGANSIYMAQHGLHVHAWDISEQAISQLERLCKQKHIHIETEIRDVHERPPAINTYDVICVSYFLDRSITQSIISALKQNGVLIYQTFIHEKISPHGPCNPDFRLSANELLRLFSSLHVLVYLEHGCVGDTSHGIRDVALLIAQKR